VTGFFFPFHNVVSGGFQGYGGAIELEAAGTDSLQRTTTITNSTLTGNQALQVNRARLVAGPLQQFRRIRQFLPRLKYSPTPFALARIARTPSYPRSFGE
jgi:hypothetical protein